MLVLTRKVGERIVIGNQIELLIAKVGAGRVKLAFGAPPDVRIRRAELRARAECSSATDCPTDSCTAAGSGRATAT